jgi:multidrug efflux system membrane fusion protein
MPASRRTFFAIAGLAVVVAAVAFVMREVPGSRAAAPKPSPAVPVSVAKVVADTVAVRLRAIGNVEAYTTVAVKARVDGQIVDVDFKEGDEVHKGETLFEIDRRPFEAQLAQAQATLV